MFRIVMLLLPGLIPSWKFFKAVEPSPRVQWRLLADPQQTGDDWQDFRPRPEHISFVTILRRMLWNPRWNEALYMVSLAERLTLNPTPHSTEQIFLRLRDEIDRTLPDASRLPYLQFRLVFVHRDGEDLVHEITHLSDPRRLQDIAP